MSTPAPGPNLAAQTTTNTYDSMGRVTAITRPGNSQTLRTYFLTGMLHETSGSLTPTVEHTRRTILTYTHAMTRILLAFKIVFFSWSLTFVVAGEEAKQHSESKLILENTIRFLKTERNFDIKDAPFSEAMGYIEIVAREHWNRLADAGVIKNSTFRSWKIKYVETELKLSYAVKSAPISAALETLCASASAIAIFDETGLSVIPDTIIIEHSRYQKVTERVYVKKHD